MIITITNAKGGVAKTTSCINIAHGLVMQNKKVLLIDLDSQASASLALGLTRDDFTPSSADVLMEDYPIEEAIRQTSIDNLHLLPASIALANYDLAMASVKGRENKLKNTLTKVKNKYDFILIDCAPSIALLPINALVAADKYIIPTAPHYLSLEGLVNFTNTVERVKSGIGAKCELLGILLTMVDKRSKASQEIIEMIRDQYKTSVFKTEIRQNVKLCEAPSFSKTIFQYNYNSVGAEGYQTLCKELIQRLKKASSNDKKTHRKKSIRKTQK